MEDYKQKYEKVINFIKDLYPFTHDYVKEKLEGYFPELKESDDVRIRKEIINHLISFNNGYYKRPSEDIIDNWVAWLGKQGEKNNVSIWKHWEDGIAGNGEDKPIYLVKTGNTYSLASCLGFKCDYIELSELDSLMLEKQGEQKPADKVEPKFKVGDYIERKDGLGCHAKIIFVGGNVYGCEKLIYPEDSSPFFEFMFKNQDEFQTSSDFKQKSAWSDEDEEMFQDIQNILSQCKSIPCSEGSFLTPSKKYKTELIDFLKSIKERVQPQPKQEWSEEDEKMVNRITHYICYIYHDGLITRKEYEEVCNWLKSLKPQSHWKPSEEQMKALDLVIVCSNESLDTKNKLESLYNDLKKL